MNEYYPIFILGLLFIVFATVQDIRKREVNNWINFSLLSFLLAYRAFYSLMNNNYNFFLYGLAGVAIFMVLANLFYYTKVFAGGDAKLLIAFGAILPFQSWNSLIYMGLAFILLLFSVGALYSLVYSLFLAIRNKKNFKKEFMQNLNKKKIYFIVSALLCILLIIEYSIVGWNGLLPYYSILVLILIPFIFVFLKSVENNSMIKLVSPQDLTEGDWLLNSIKIGNLNISKSVHGLSFREIKLIRKNNKKVWIKYGLPFVPAFFITFLIMEYVFLILKFDLMALLLSLF